MRPPRVGATTTTCQPKREQQPPNLLRRELEARERQDQGARVYGAVEMEFRELSAREQMQWTHRTAGSLASDHPGMKSRLTKAWLEQGAWQSAMLKRSVLEICAQ